MLCWLAFSDAHSGFLVTTFCATRALENKSNGTQLTYLPTSHSIQLLHINSLFFFLLCCAGLGATSFLCGRSSRRTLQVDHEDKGWLEKSECTWLSSCLAVYCPQRSCYLQHRKPESLTQAESSKAQKHTTCCICSERDDECLHGLCWLTWCFNHLQDCLLTPCPFESFLYSHSLLPPSFWWACLFAPLSLCRYLSLESSTIRSIVKMGDKKKPMPSTSRWSLDNYIFFKLQQFLCKLTLGAKYSVSVLFSEVKCGPFFP